MTAIKRLVRVVASFSITAIGLPGAADAAVFDEPPSFAVPGERHGYPSNTPDSTCFGRTNMRDIAIFAAKSPKTNRLAGDRRPFSEILKKQALFRPHGIAV
jgi:hypothetical protein